LAAEPAPWLRCRRPVRGGGVPNRATPGKAPSPGKAVPKHKKGGFSKVMRARDVHDFGEDIGVWKPLTFKATATRVPPLPAAAVSRRAPRSQRDEDWPEFSPCKERDHRGLLKQKQAKEMAAAQRNLYSVDYQVYAASPGRGVGRAQRSLCEVQNSRGPSAAVHAAPPQ
jgi:hypothetical protein